MADVPTKKDGKVVVAKRGRGRPAGSGNKQKTAYKEPRQPVSKCFLISLLNFYCINAALYIYILMY